jgi:hypothetical protein
MVLKENNTLLSRYIKLTTITLPALAKRKHRDWPVVEDHCFVRIVLDNICQDVWYKHISAPAYQYLKETQLVEAIALCEAIIEGSVSIDELNQRSLKWRRNVQGNFDF